MKPCWLRSSCCSFVRAGNSSGRGPQHLNTANHRQSRSPSNVSGRLLKLIVFSKMRLSHVILGYVLKEVHILSARAIMNVYYAQPVTSGAYSLRIYFEYYLYFNRAYTNKRLAIETRLRDN